jgi:hypothetical protein
MLFTRSGPLPDNLGHRVSVVPQHRDDQCRPRRCCLDLGQKGPTPRQLHLADKLGVGKHIGLIGIREYVVRGMPVPLAVKNPSIQSTVR